jgi:hypothetical protein
VGRGRVSFFVESRTAPYAAQASARNGFETTLLRREEVTGRLAAYERLRLKKSLIGEEWMALRQIALGTKGHCAPVGSGAAGGLGPRC